VIGAAGVVLAALAGADEDAAVPARRRLADLHVEMFAVQGDLPGYGYAAEVGPHVIGAGFKAERRGQSFEALAAGCVKASFLRVVVGAGGVPVHGMSPGMKKPAIKRGLGSWIAGVSKDG